MNKSMHGSSVKNFSTQPDADSYVIPDDFELDLSLEDGAQFEVFDYQPAIAQSAYLHSAKREPLFEYEEALANFYMVCDEIKSTGDYKSSRERYRSASFELNVHRKQAPFFRRKLQTGRKLNDPIFLQIHRDNITIDCHWLYCIEADVVVNTGDSSFSPLFDYSQPFDFDLADSFAAKKWKTENRTLEVLRLIEFYQMQCVALRSDALKSKIKSLDQPRKENNKRVPSIRSVFEHRLLTWGATVKSIRPHYATYRTLWMLHMVLGSSVNNRMLSTLTAFALGQPQKDPKTIKTQLNTLLKRVYA